MLYIYADSNSVTYLSPPTINNTTFFRPKISTHFEPTVKHSICNWYPNSDDDPCAALSNRQRSQTKLISVLVHSTSLSTFEILTIQPLFNF